MRKEIIRFGETQQWPMRLLITESIQDRVRGLEGFAPLGPDDGMLFVVPTGPRWVTFHMGGVTFPIDIIFLVDGRVTRIATLQPGSDELVDELADLVLETQAGWAAKKGVTVGTVLLTKRPDTLTRTAMSTYDPLRSIVGEDDLAVAPESPVYPEGVVPGKCAQILWLTASPRLPFAVMATLSRIESMLRRGTTPRALAAYWRRRNHSLNERDIIARTLASCGFEEAGLTLLRTAQTDSELPSTTRNPPGAVRRMPPDQQFNDKAIPADLPGVGVDSPDTHFIQNFGYDPMVEGPPMRPGSHDHAKQVCSCGNVILQCRCLEGGRKIIIIENGCSDCEAKRARQASSEIHPGDRVKLVEDVEGLSKDDMGTCEEIQNDAIKVRLDSEPVPRWLTRDLLTLDKSKEDVLKEDEEGEGGGDEGGGGLESLLQGLGG